MRGVLLRAREQQCAERAGVLAAREEQRLAAERDDSARVSWLVRRVVHGADELERALDADLDLGAEDAGEILSLEVDDGR